MQEVEWPRPKTDAGAYPALSKMLSGADLHAAWHFVCLLLHPQQELRLNGKAGPASRLPADVMHGLDAAAAWCHAGSTTVQAALMVQSHKLNERIGSNAAVDHERPH